MIVLDTNVLSELIKPARATGSAVATRNISDFQGCGVKLIDPWQERSRG